jgi:hypothetical protein
MPQTMVLFDIRISLKIVTNFKSFKDKIHPETF